MARDGEDLGVLPSQEWSKGGRGRVKGEREGRVEEKDYEGRRGYVDEDGWSTVV